MIDYASIAVSVVIPDFVLFTRYTGSSHTHTHTDTCIYVHAHTHARTHAHTYAHDHTHPHTYMQNLTNMYGSLSKGVLSPFIGIVSICS